MNNLLFVAMLAAIAVLGWMTFKDQKGKYGVRKAAESATNENGFANIVMPEELRKARSTSLFLSIVLVRLERRQIK